MRLGLAREPTTNAQAGARWTARHPHITLMIFNVVACLFFLLSVLGTPFIQGIYLFEMDISEWSLSFAQNYIEVMTFGTLGSCWKGEKVKACSRPVIGYESDALPAVLSPIARALALHIISIVLSIVTIPAIALGHYKKAVLNKIHKWAFKINVLLALMAMACFSVDLGFYFEAKQYYVAGHTTLGSGIWSTLGGSMLLLLGGWLFDIQSKQCPYAENRHQIVGTSDESSIQQRLPDIESGEQANMNLLGEVLRKTLSKYGRDQGRSVEAIFGSTGTYEVISSTHGGRDQQPVGNLQTDDDDDAKPPIASRKSEWIFVEKSDSPVSLHKRASTLSGYAPLSYHTYAESEGPSPTSAQAARRSATGNAASFAEPQTPQSTTFAVPTNRSSKQSVVDPTNRPPSWLSKSYTKLKKPRSSHLPSVSTLSSLIHEFPPIPATPPSGRRPYHPYSIFTIGRALGTGAPGPENPPRVPAKADESIPLENMLTLERKSMTKAKNMAPDG